MLRADEPLPACAGLFIDVGANIGDSLYKFYRKPNCFERCLHYKHVPVPDDLQPRPCRLANETCATTGTCANANETCFCSKHAAWGNCGYEWPYWLPLGRRRTFCADAFEPNPQLAPKLRAVGKWLTSSGLAPHVRIHNGTALSTRDGVAPFALDTTSKATNLGGPAVGSSLVLDKRALGADGKPGRGAALGNRVLVRTLDAVRYVRSLPTWTRGQHVAFKLDVEGSEFTMLRELLVSGALCAHVDTLWVEWHGGGRLDWRSLGLPIHETSLAAVYKWMLTGALPQRRGGAAQAEHGSMLSSHCRTRLAVSWA